MKLHICGNIWSHQRGGNTILENGRLVRYKFLNNFKILRIPPTRCHYTTVKTGNVGRTKTSTTPNNNHKNKYNSKSMNENQNKNNNNTKHKNNNKDNRNSNNKSMIRNKKKQ